MKEPGTEAAAEGAAAISDLPGEHEDAGEEATQVEEDEGNDEDDEVGDVDEDSVFVVSADECEEPPQEEVRLEEPRERTGSMDKAVVVAPAAPTLRRIATPQQHHLLPLPNPPLAGSTSYSSLGSLRSLNAHMSGLHISTPEDRALDWHAHASSLRS